MASQWFYLHEGIKTGPFSGPELVALAADGQIERTDTVWKEGTERGLPAHEVKNLFPNAVLAVVPVEAAPLPESPALPVDLVPVTPVVAAASAEATAPPRPPARPVAPSRATGIRGVIVVSQDGVRVNFKKVCTVCAFESPGRLTMLIRNGRMRADFFCPKCRKSRPVEIQGVAGR